MSHTSKLEVTTPSDIEIQMTRRFDAPKQAVFDAWTRPELLKQWLCGPDGHTLAVCDVDLRVGGSLRYVWHSPKGNEMALSGEFKQVDPPNRLVHTELFDEDWTGGETLVTLQFDEDHGQTTLTMTVRYASKDARDGALQTPMAEGMEMCYARLEKILAATSA